MVKENLIPKTETVQEIDNEIPSFEEFMKTYEGGRVNYDDLKGGNISEVKGYGPCTNSNCTHSREELQNQLREEEEKKETLQNQLSRANSRNITVVQQNITNVQQKIIVLIKKIQESKKPKVFELWVRLENRQMIGNNKWCEFRISGRHNAGLVRAIIVKAEIWVFQEELWAMIFRRDLVVR